MAANLRPARGGVNRLSPCLIPAPKFTSSRIAEEPRIMRFRWVNFAGQRSPNVHARSQPKARVSMPLLGARKAPRELLNVHQGGSGGTGGGSGSSVSAVRPYFV